MFLKGERCDSPKCALFRKQQAPGQHGNSRRRPSEYALQLREKQKVKRMYGVLEKQFKRYFREAERSKEDTSKLLLQKLERRLDNAVYRANLAASRAQARQFVTHGKVQVNGIDVNKPSYQVSEGDVITVQADLLDIPERPKPDWLVVDEGKKEAKVTRLPEREDIGLDIDESMIVEFYSR